MNLIYKILSLLSFTINVSGCDVNYTPCEDIICPKINDITSCISETMNDYSTYKLSLVIDDEYVENIYAIYGDDKSTLEIPSAYQSGVLNNNLGGVPDNIRSILPETILDSWLTIGITNGDTQNNLGSVGINFQIWDEKNGIITDNGAIYVTDPNQILSDTNEYLIAQLTLKNNQEHRLKINVQGHIKNDITINNHWSRTNIIFTIEEKNNIPNLENCDIWYDGCNSCSVINNQIDHCTEKICNEQDSQRCLLHHIGY
tara:strand:+ start:286 stop:1059 length:774 start_codon:yes stop_codon:yes gene_type:complete